MQQWGPPRSPPSHEEEATARARRRRWEAHFEARRALIAQVEWQPAPPDLDPDARVDGLARPGAVTRHYNFRDYVVNFAERLKRPSVWRGSSGRAYTSTSTRIRAATIDDDAEFAATRLDHLRNQQALARAQQRGPDPFDPTLRIGGDTARMRSEVGPENASYMHAKMAIVVDSTAFMFKRDMQVRPPTLDDLGSWRSDRRVRGGEREGYMADLPPDLWPFYEMELRCDPRWMDPAAWRVDITAKREPDETIQTSALCVCRPVTRFRVFRGDDSDNPEDMRRRVNDPVSFPDALDDPAYVILTALRQRVFDSNGNELTVQRFNVDDYVVATKRYAPVLDLSEDQFGVQNFGWAADAAVHFLNGEREWSDNIVTVLNKFPLMLEGDCFRNWKQLSRAVRSVGPALAEARERAAERVYAPDAAGAEDARANFERLAREQEREKQRQRDREARQAEGQSPQRAAAAETLPSLAALRV